MVPVSPHLLQSNASTMTKTRRPTLRQIRELVAFLPQLYPEGFIPIKRWNTHNKDGTLSFPWPEYDELVDKFFQAASSEWWCDHNYDPDKADLMLENEGAIETATLSQVKTMLTYCVRGERFCDGHWGTMITGGHIRRLLERLDTIGS